MFYCRLAVPAYMGFAKHGWRCKGICLLIFLVALIQDLAWPWERSSRSSWTTSHRTRLKARGCGQARESIAVKFPVTSRSLQCHAVRAHFSMGHMETLERPQYGTRMPLTISWLCSSGCEESIWTRCEGLAWSSISRHMGMEREQSEPSFYHSWKMSCNNATCSNWYNSLDSFLNVTTSIPSRSSFTPGFKMLQLPAELSCPFRHGSTTHMKTPCSIWMRTNCIFCIYSEACWRRRPTRPARSSKRSLELNSLSRLSCQQRRNKWPIVSMTPCYLVRSKHGISGCMRKALRPTGCRCKSMLLKASFGEATGLNTSGLLEEPYQSSRQCCSIYLGRTYCECSRRTVHEAFGPDHRDWQSNRCSIRHAHALGCLLIFSVALAICTARSGNRVLWQTWRVIPGIYRRRHVLLPVKPRYTCANGQTVVQAANSMRTFGLTYMCGHETCFVSLLELPFCASCMFCLRKALGMLLVDHCGLQPVDNRLQTWSCRGHSALLQHMRGARMFLDRTALDLNSARDVPQSLSHGCTVTVTYVILRRSARINGSGHKDASSHGNNNQPRLNMVLALRPGPQFRKQGSVLKCPRVCSGTITQCPVQTGPTAFGRVIAPLRKVALPSCLRAISDPELDMCRSGANQRHVCQGRLKSDQPASQESQSQRDGLLSAPSGPQHTEDAYARVATIGRMSQVDNKQREAMVKEHGLRRVSGKAQCNTTMMKRSHSGRPLRKVSQQGVASTVCSVLCKAAFVCLLLGSCCITSHTMICMKCRPSQVCDAWGVGSCPSTVNLIVQLNLSCRGRFTSEAMCSAQEQPIAGSASQLGSHLDVCCTAYHIWISAMIVASVSYISKHTGALCNQLVLRPFKSAHLTITHSTQTSPQFMFRACPVLSPGVVSHAGVPVPSFFQPTSALREPLG